SRTQAVGQGLALRATRALRDAERRGDGGCQPLRLCQRREIHEVCSVGEVRSESVSNVERETGLTAATRTGEGHKPRAREQARDRVDFPTAAKAGIDRYG